MEELMKTAGFDKCETDFFSTLYTKLDNQDKELLDILGEKFTTHDDIETCQNTQKELDVLAEKYCIDAKSVYMIFFLSNLDKMKQIYADKNIPGDIFFEMLKDLKYKLDECKKVYGVYGTNSFYWYYKILKAEIIPLGRFQYQADKFYGESYTWGDITVTNEDDVVRIHIPSSGAMTQELRMESYKKAFEYYGKTKGEYLLITCVSYLLYEGNREVYPEGSNLLDFMNDFDITENVEPTEPFSNAWRVFNTAYTGDISKLPAKTTLQKNYIKYLEQGKSVGTGKGIIIFDGEKIVNKK